MADNDELVMQLSNMVSALNDKLNAFELEQQITKIHMATMTGLIVDALPDKVARMIEILRAAEQEADDALHIEAFGILRKSLEHAANGNPSCSEKPAPPSWLKGVIDGKKPDNPQDSDN